MILIFWIAVIFIVTIFVLGQRSERRKKKKALRIEMYSAPGVRNLLEDGRDEEAVDVYQKFAGVDEYTARDMVEKIKREME